MTRRIRIDDDAVAKLDELSKEFAGTKSGLASEAIRRGIEQLREEFSKSESGDEDVENE